MASNFGKTRFERFRNFHFLTSEKQIGTFFRFVIANFGGDGQVLTCNHGRSRGRVSGLGCGRVRLRLFKDASPPLSTNASPPLGTNASPPFKDTRVPLPRAKPAPRCKAPQNETGNVKNVRNGSQVLNIWTSQKVLWRFFHSCRAAIECRPSIHSQI